jgi:ATP-dependent Clp protease ATP-binding subunit ClpA
MRWACPGNPRTPSTESENRMFERLRQKSPAVEVIRSAVQEARLRGDRRIGTEHLLLGLLHDREADPARTLGVDLHTARAELARLDREALAAIGLAVPLPRTTSAGPAGKPPSLGALTSNARSALDTLLASARSRNSHLAPNHLLVALLALRPPDPAAELISMLGIDRSDAHGRLPLT